MERRTVLRAGAVAWAAPTIAAATAAPAFAASTSLAITAFSAAYSAQGLAAVRPDLLTFSVQITNNGAPTTSLSFELLIPKGVARFGTGNLYVTMPTVTGGAGWSSLVEAIVDPTNSHRVTFTRTGAQILGGGSLVLSDAVIKFSPAVAEGSPYKAWVGSAYTIGGVAKAANATGPVTSTANVAESSSGAPSLTDTALTVNSFVPSRSGASLTVRVGPTTGTGHNDIGAVTNSGRKTCGPITLSFVVPTVAGHQYYAGIPSATVTAPSGWTYVGRSAAAPWTYTFTVTAPPVAVATSAATNSPAQVNTPDFGNTVITLSNAGSGTTTPQSITANASALSGAGTDAKSA